MAARVSFPGLESALAELAIEQLRVRRFQQVDPVRRPGPIEAQIASWRDVESAVDVAAVAVAQASHAEPAITVVAERLRAVASASVPGLDLDGASLGRCSDVVSVLAAFRDASSARLTAFLHGCAARTLDPPARSKLSGAFYELGLAAEAWAVLVPGAAQDDPVLVAARIDLLRREGRLAEALKDAIGASRRWPRHPLLAAHVRKLSARQNRIGASAAPTGGRETPSLRQAALAVEDLFAQGNDSAALETMWNLRELFFETANGALGAIKVLMKHLPRRLLKLNPALIEALGILPPDLQLQMSRIARAITPHRLATIAAGAANLGSAMVFWRELAHATFEVNPPVAGEVEDRAAANWILARCGGVSRTDGMGESALSRGYFVPRLDIVGLRRATRIRETWKAGAFLNYESAVASLTPRGQAFVDQIRQGGGAFVFSVHALQDVGLQKQLMLVALSAQGLRCLHLREQSDATEHPGEEVLAALPLAPEYINRNHVGAMELVAQLAGAVRAGGVAHVPVDNAWDVADVAIVPWFLRPHELAEFTGRIALMADGAIAFGSSFADIEGRMVVDFDVVPKPSAELGLRTRAIWLMQRLGRHVRDSYAQLRIPLSPSQVAAGGGVPLVRELTPVAGYLDAHPAVRASLFGRLLLDPAFPLDRPALRARNSEATFGDVRRRALSCAAMLLHFQELKPEHVGSEKFRDQHRVLAILPPGEALVALGLGALAAGSMFCICEATASLETIRNRIASFAPDLVIAVASVADKIGGDTKAPLRMLICDDAGDGEATEDLVHSFSAADALPPFDPDRPAITVFTSGSTGKPKAIVLTHRLHSVGYRWKPPREDSRHAAVVRSDTVGYAGLLTTLRDGSLLEIIPREIASQHNAFVSYLKEQRITALSAPSTIWHALVEAEGFTSANLPAFRGGVAWGERLSRPAAEAIARRFPAIWLAVTYGATEASHVSSRVLVSDGFIRDDQGTVIEPVHGAKLRAIDDAGNEITEPGVVGRLEVTGNNVMLGYFAELFARNAAVTGTETRTLVVGDLVSPTGDGTFALIGRADSIVKIGGRRISLLEIEAAAERLEPVRRAVAIAHAGQLTTEIYLAVEASRAISPVTIATAVAAATVPEARPRKVLIVDRLPVLDAGKVDSEAVARLFDARTEQPDPSDMAPALAPDPDPHRNNGAVTRDAVVAEIVSWLNQNGAWEADVDALAATSLVDNYFDSILQLDLLIHLEKEFGVAIGNGFFGREEHATFGSLAAAIAASAKGDGPVA